MPNKIIFYTTDGCHLCEQAEQLLVAVLPANRIEKVDIIDDDALVARYGERLPIVCRQVEGEVTRELAWPFSLLDLQGFVSAQ